jgi:glycosyltransferase involved in cell wall biosynthesis
MPKNRLAFIHAFQLRMQRGIEVYLWELASALVQKGMGVDILTWAGPLSVPSFVSPEVKVKHGPFVRYYEHLAAIPYYAWNLTNNNYDHVFVNFAGYGEGPALNLARRIKEIPFSVVFHFPPSLVPNRYCEFARWGFQTAAANLIGVSHSTAQEVEQWAGRSCELIGHGVDTRRFKADADLRAQIRRELGIPSDVPVLISVAALEERKGIQWGIRALSQLFSVYPDIQYVIVGEGEYLSQLEQLSEDLDIKPNLHFVGAKLNVQPYLCAADIMLILSRGEASSISLLEALACQLPCITSDLPPFTGWVDDSWGIKVDEKNIEVVATTVSHLIDNQSFRIEMGKTGRAYVEKNHIWSQVAEKYLDLIS